MARFFPYEEITIRNTILDSDGDPVEPAAVTFEYKRGRGGTRYTADVTDIGDGLFEASFTPDQGGTWFYRWKSTTPALVKEGFVKVDEGFDDGFLSTDYGD